MSVVVIYNEFTDETLNLVTECRHIQIYTHQKTN